MIETWGKISRMAAMASMVEEGLTPEDAARITGLKLATCRSYFSIVRRNNPFRHRRPSNNGRRAIWIDVDVLDRLQPYATDRRLPMPEFVRDLLSTIADEQLVTAVLDDGQTS